MQIPVNDIRNAIAVIRKKYPGTEVRQAFNDFERLLEPAYTQPQDPRPVKPLTISLGDK
jgi:hypothetical protein